MTVKRTHQKTAVYKIGMNTIRRTIDQFVENLVGLLHEAVLEEITQRLDGPVTTIPPAPRRQPVYKSDDDLTPAEARVLSTLREARTPVTSWVVAHRLDRAESTVRYQLGNLVAKRKATKKILEGRQVVYTAA